MATCSEYYSAEDQDGNNLPFTAYFDLYSWNGSFWEYVDTLDMPPGSVQSVTLTQGEKYRGVAETYSGWHTPDPIEITACSPDFNFVYVIGATEFDIFDGRAVPPSQTHKAWFDISVDIKNTGLVGGYFVMKYYEGTTHLRTLDPIWINAEQTIYNFVESFIMVDRNFVVTAKMYQEGAAVPDDTYNVTCYLIGGTDYYVKTDGNDGLSGSSWANAWATIDKAARTVPDGSTVHIGFGTYDNEPAGNKIAPQNVGASGIYYAPETAGSEGGTGTVSIEKNA